MDQFDTCQLRVSASARRRCRLTLINKKPTDQRGSVLVSEGGQFLLSLDMNMSARHNRRSARPMRRFETRFSTTCSAQPNAPFVNGAKVPTSPEQRVLNGILDGSALLL